MLKVSAPELVSGVSGESEQKLRELFEQAIVRNTPLIKYIRSCILLFKMDVSVWLMCAVLLFHQSSAPCILFIDEIDAITPKREMASKDMERRIVAQLLTCMDGVC